MIDGDRSRRSFAVALPRAPSGFPSPRQHVNKFVIRPLGKSLEQVLAPFPEICATVFLLTSHATVIKTAVVSQIQTCREIPTSYVIFSWRLATSVIQREQYVRSVRS